jgi:hypothetical protein
MNAANGSTAKTDPRGRAGRVQTAGAGGLAPAFFLVPPAGMRAGTQG